MRRSHFSVFANDGPHGASRSLRSTIKTVFFLLFFYPFCHNATSEHICTEPDEWKRKSCNPSRASERASAERLYGEPIMSSVQSAVKVLNENMVFRPVHRFKPLRSDCG